MVKQFITTSFIIKAAILAPLILVIIFAWLLYYDATRKIEIKSYNGTGTAGSSSSPTSVTFSFDPNYILCCGYKSSNAFRNKDYSFTCVEMSVLTTSFQLFDAWGYSYNSYSGQSMRLKKSSDGKTIYWYALVDNQEYMVNNTSGYKYYYIGIK